jgi:DNA-binding NtrC family response regulator
MKLAPQASATPRVLVTQGLEVPEVWVRRLVESLRPVTVDVVPARSSAGAMEQVSHLRPDVVVLDEPSLTDVGWRLLRQIRRLDVDVACLMVLRRAEPALLNRALQLSAYSVFEVPVDVELMGRMVARLLTRVNDRSS